MQVVTRSINKRHSLILYKSVNNLTPSPDMPITWQPYVSVKWLWVNNRNSFFYWRC